MASLTFESAEGLLERAAPTAWARHFDRAEFAGDLFTHPAPHLVRDVGRKLADIAHEGLARDLPTLHLPQLGLPVARELRLGQGVGVEIAQQRDERKPL